MHSAVKNAVAKTDRSKMSETTIDTDEMTEDEVIEVLKERKKENERQETKYGSEIGDSIERD